MKAPAIFSLDVTTVQQIEDVATETRVSKSALVDMLIRFGLAKIPKERLQAWAAAADGKPTNVEAPLRQSERMALGTLSDEWIEFKALQERSRQSDGVHWRALNGLRVRGMAEMRDASKTARHYRTGRPMQSFWRRVQIPDTMNTEEKR